MKTILVAIILVNFAIGPPYWAKGTTCIDTDMGPICSVGDPDRINLGASKHRLFIDRAVLISKLSAARRNHQWHEYDVRMTYHVLTSECAAEMEDRSITWEMGKQGEVVMVVENNIPWWVWVVTLGAAGAAFGVGYTVGR